MPTKPTADPQPFFVRRSSIQGRGGFATRDIRKGERVVEYLGERISWKEADRRYDDDGMRRHHTFLFAVNTRTVIDGAVEGNDARFINHACDPNCEAVDDDGRIFIEALCNIAAGQELNYDYAYARDESTTAADEEIYACRCGSPKCRGTILEPAKSKQALPKVHHVAARHPHEHLGPKRAAPAQTKRGATRSGANGASPVKTRPKNASAGKPSAGTVSATKSSTTKSRRSSATVPARQTAPRRAKAR